MDLFDADDPFQQGLALQDAADANLKQIGLAVYKEVWDEFYSWEQAASRELIASLSAATPSHIRSTSFSHQFDDEAVRSQNSEDIGPGESFTVVEYEGTAIHSHQLSCTEIIAGLIKPYPKYRACTPASRSIMGDELLDEWAAFLPFADDPSFKIKNYLAAFIRFYWEIDFIDPDLELIQIETARRLYHGEGMTYNDIDRIGILRAHRLENDSGLLWDVSQRDKIAWPGSALSPFPELPTNFISDDDDLYTHINRGIAEFCPNLNCLHHRCSVHKTPYANIDPIKATVTSVSMKLSDGDPCGNDCFRLIDETANTFMEGVYWDNPADIETLASLLKMMPDLFPCDLAVICRKRCHEVFVYRGKLLSDEKILDGQYIEGPLRRGPRVPPTFADNTHDGTPGYIILNPCAHKGPCDITSGCPCLKEKQHCQRSCRCGFDCTIRWQGCSCKLTKHHGACPPATCPCRQSGKECDPELCIGCRARLGGSWTTGCRNVQIQQGTAQFIEIKRAKFGLGAFATSDIRKDWLIGDYIGEILRRDVSDALGILHEHTGLNYVFERDSKMLLDAAKVGNETRYLNHSKNPNCESKVLLVNGEHHIGLFATRHIRQGEELFLDYGATYWINAAPEEY